MDLTDNFRMQKAKESMKKTKPLPKSTFSALSLKKNTSGLLTSRPKFVQKQVTEENQPKSNKKTFFNRTQNFNATNRSFEKMALESHKYSDMRSRTPSPMRGCRPESNEKLVEKILSANRKRKQDGLVEHLIDNILGFEDSEVESPKQAIKRLNQEVVELRLKNIRLEKEIKKVKEEKSIVPRDVLEDLIIDVFELIVVFKSIYATDKLEVVMDLLKDKSKSLMLKLNPLTCLLDLQSRMKERGTQLKSDIDNSVKSPKFPLSSLIKLMGEDSTPKLIKTTETSTISRTIKSSSIIADSLQTSGLIIQEETQSENEESFSPNDKSNSTMIYHHSKTESEENVMGVATCDFSGSNVLANDLNLKRGDKVKILKRTSSQWWIGMRDNVVGYFPAENVRID